MRVGSDVDSVVAAMRAGDEAAFSELADRHRRELQAHCYRMLGSLEDSEDMVQETLLRAWRRRSTYEARASFRAWLYRIATNACLDALARRRAAPRAVDPYVRPGSPPDPDRVLERIRDTRPEPDAEVVAKETIELAFLTMIQHLPARQRVVLILRRVVGLSAKESAALLEDSVASVNSALQRANRTLQDRLPERRLEWRRGSDPSDEERALLQRYVKAIEHADADAFVDVLCDGRCGAPTHAAP